MAAKRKANNKKKGPKGKRARAKAKLERQWGEEADEPVSLRKSRSRLLSSSRQVLSKTDGDSRAEDKYDEESESKDQESPRYKTGRFNPFKSLISQIHGSNNMELDDDEQDHHKADCTISGSQDEDFSSSDDDDDDDAENGSDIEGRALLEHVDGLFTKRFIEGDQYRPIMNESNQEVAADGISLRSKIQLSETWEMQVSSPTLSRMLPRKQHTWHAKMILAQEEEKEQIGSLAESLLSEGRVSRVAAAALNVISSYADLLVTDGQQPLIRDQIQSVVIRHILAHVLRYRSAIAETEERMRKVDVSEPEANEVEGGERRDQGFVRPTVLVLLPTRDCCFQFLQKLTKQAKKVEIWNRFEEEYGPSPSDGTKQHDNEHRQRVLKSKSADWKELFSDEKNSDDDFKIGVQWNVKKNRCRLYTDFLNSDIIVASPLGLKMLKEFDCLSSIEICLVARADVLAQQNWDHVNDILANLNQQPNSTNDTDFSRVREYCLAGKTSLWRQTIFCTAFLSPEILSSFRQCSLNQDGHVKIRKRFPDPQVTSCDRQVFTKVACRSFAEAGSSLVQYFFDKLFEKLEEQTMVFISSYFDFVNVRNTLLRQEFDDFVSITEYSQSSEVTRGRARFLQRQRKLLLYTGRAHFFMRHAIKGVRHIVFLGVPEYPSFYVDHVGRLESAADEPATCQVLFTRFDALALERIVGSANSNRMINGEKTVYTLTATM